MEFPFAILPANEFDAVGFGTNAVDYLIRVPGYPTFDTKVELTSHQMAFGGEAASSMAGLARLGLRTAYSGRFGGDTTGQSGIGSLREERVDVSFAETVDGAETQVAFIIIDERTGERTVLWKRDHRLAYAAHEAPVDLARLGRVLHLTPHDTAACVAMAKSAKAAGVVVSADVDNAFDGIEELLALVDVCIVSSEFPQRLLGVTEPEIGLQRIAETFGCGVTGITQGQGGSLIYCSGTLIATPAFDVPGGCIDTTGAGDAFRTGFLYGMLTGSSVEGSARAANAVAALKCRQPGARAGLPSEAELAEMLG